jgi:hypothetical protein
MITAALALASIFSACNQDRGLEEEPGEDLFTNKGSTLKFNKTPTLDWNTGEYINHRVYHTVWYEPEEDPRQVIGYELENGIPFFDHFVFLYGMRLVARDCNAEPKESEGRCRLTGAHACFGHNMWVYQDEWETHMKPLRDRGIKVLMSIVPAGYGAVATCYRWPMEQWFPWTEITGQPAYRYNDEAMGRLIAQLRDFQQQYRIDGFAFDGEYGGPITVTIDGVSVERGTTPAGNWSGRGFDSASAWKVGGENLLRLMHDLNVAVYGNDYDKYDDEYARTTSDRNRRLIFESYEQVYANYIPESFRLPDNHPDEASRGQWIYRKDLLDLSFHSFYGTWAPNTHMPGSWPNNRYGPVSVALADNKDTAPLPKPMLANGSGVIPRMQQQLGGNYGVVMYYCLRSRDELSKGIEKWNRDSWPAIYGPDNIPETYLTQISETLHGMKTRYVGDDYPRRFETQ